MFQVTEIMIVRFLLERGLRFRNLGFCGHDLMETAKKLNGSLIGGGGRSRFGRACEVAMSTSCFSPFKTLITIYLGVSC